MSRGGATWTCREEIERSVAWTEQGSIVVADTVPGGAGIVPVSTRDLKSLARGNRDIEVSASSPHPTGQSVVTKISRPSFSRTCGYRVPGR